jgi:hypothetical protein
MVATPNLLADPGVLYYAPLGSTLPANTVVGSVFTDAWPVAWLSPGMTADGTELHATTTVSPIAAAESIDPIAYRTTDRVSNLALALLSNTATNLALALNGATKTITGSTTTTMTSVTPVGPGLETRYMWGWQSTDATIRFVGFQGINSGDLALQMKKAPTATTYALTVNLEIPSTGSAPFQFWFAGVNRG